MVRLPPLGCIVECEWAETIRKRPYLESNAAIVMPNHFHAVFTLTRDGIDGIEGRGVACYGVLRPPTAGTKAS